MALIEITGLDPALVLMALYNNARLQGSGTYAPGAGTDLTVDEARRALREQEWEFGRVDYLKGRVLKVRLGIGRLESGDYFDPWHNDNGEGKAARVLH